ncbi:hypothetical protein [Flaviaesturariibacter aridisoli]|uniref:Uncharacterized protein n=1 Tax=Flaviaesturariibacter aridisoli TaxID=2545761 RepID=A0A4R4DRN7_9BACT|nr:hypothetical protein [Flaviaesturariibacter aridisoli]TCZ65109.1 hypothetical protein E0486_17800 [Flaviaesturariibacter aridisoli]
MVKLFCSEVQVDESTFETLISVFSRDEGTSFVINIKDLRLTSTRPDEETQRLLAEELQEAIGRFYNKVSATPQLKAV